MEAPQDNSHLSYACYLPGVLNDVADAGVGTTGEDVDLSSTDMDKGRVILEEVALPARRAQALSQGPRGLEFVAPLNLAQEKQARAQIEGLPAGPKLKAPSHGFQGNGTAYVRVSKAFGKKGRGVVDQDWAARGSAWKGLEPSA